MALQLKEKQLAFCEQYIANNFNGSKAYGLAYGNENKKTCAVEANRLLKDQRVIDRIKEVEGSYRIIGHTLGVNKKLIMQTIKKQLEAKKAVFFNGREVGEMNDNTAILNAANTYLKITGDLAPEKLKVDMNKDDGLADINPDELTKEEQKKLKEDIIKQL